MKKLKNSFFFKKLEFSAFQNAFFSHQWREFDVSCKQEIPVHLQVPKTPTEIRETPRNSVRASPEAKNWGCAKNTVCWAFVEEIVYPQFKKEYSDNDWGNLKTLGYNNKKEEDCRESDELRLKNVKKATKNSWSGYMAPGARNTNEFSFQIEVSKSCQLSTCDLVVWYNRGATYPFRKFEYKCKSVEVVKSEFNFLDEYRVVFEKF